MRATAEEARKLGVADFLLLGLLVILVFVASDALGRAWKGGTLIGSSSAALPTLEELTPIPEVRDGVQEIYVDAEFGFNPQTILAAPGMPLVIEFGESASDGGAGCYKAVYFPQLDEELGLGEIDLTDGGAVVEIGPLEPGQYEWACWMDMVTGLIVVE